VAVAGCSSVGDLLGRVDGVCLTGGPDVSPGFGGTPGAAADPDLDPGRDEFELALVARAVQLGTPLLGICRGVQVIAVALGGRLQDHVDGHGSGTWGSAAKSVLAGARSVNSFHHQAVADPGARLEVTAWAVDGTVEAVEGVEGARILGVQWHPELLEPTTATRLAPFRWLVARAGAS
jgi:putative glutamine amidotransferase